MTGYQDPLIGKRLGGCRIERELGRGGMGAVYEGRDGLTGRPVAVKVMNRAMSEDAEAVRRFEREAKVAGQIDHPHVARVMASGVEGDVRYLVMEYVQGRPLGDILKEKGHLPGPTALRIILQTAQGLAAAHEIGAIHRDIKPENLMIDDDGQVKIVDFGLARQENADSFKTATGAVMGTPHYMAPEQALGKETDHRTDIYCLGATAYHILTGKTPFTGENAFDIIQKHVKDDVRAMTVWNANVPDTVAQIVYRMMSKRPDDRFQTYGHLVKVLEDAIEGRARPSMTMEVVEEKPAEAADGFFARRKGMLIGGGAVLFALVIAGIAMRPGGSEEDSARAAGPAYDLNATNAGYRTQLIPLLGDINKAIREGDEAVTNFESRRARNNKKN